MNSATNTKRIIAPKIAIAEGSDTLPSRLLILPWGESPYDGGTQKLIVNETSLSLIPQMQRASNFDKLALDFNHNSIPGSESYTGEPVKVAAYGVIEIVPTEGIYLANLEWTADGEKAWRGKYYKDISPAVLPDENGVVSFIHSAALCRNGRIPGLEAFNADFLKLKPKVNMDKYKQMVCRLLGVDVNTDDAAIEAAFQKAVSQLGKENKDKKDAIEKKLETFSAEFDALKKTVASIVDQHAQMLKDAILEAALKDGKVVPEDAKKLAPEALKTFCASLPSVVPTHRRTPEGLKEFSANPPSDPIVNGICATLGLTEDEYKKGM